MNRPRTRGECEEGARPCPWVSCRHHLALDVSSRGTMFSPRLRGLQRRTIPDVAEEWCDDLVDHLDDMAETCCLDVADRGPQRLEAIGRVLGITRERVRQIEIIAMGRVRAADQEVAS